MKKRLGVIVGAVVLTGAISALAAGCVAVPVPGPDYAYGPPPPVVVVPAPAYGGYYRAVTTIGADTALIAGAVTGTTDEVVLCAKRQYRAQFNVPQPSAAHRREPEAAALRALCR